ncbi:hypothetical protein HDU81_004207 [Chytriomyces hyalinus]|nr:hypothetical protein HDU81_004207 [Chytriomyces hyalinus]
MPTVDVSLYLVTERSFLPPGKSVQDSVREAIAGGVSIVQLREKTATGREFLRLARELRDICAEAGVPFIVNDRIDVAMAVDADGVHIGQEDIPLKDARRLLGPNKIIGVTVKTIEQALAAVDGGADYIAPGVVFPTTTKDNAVYLGPSGVGEIIATVRQHSAIIPIVTIGGINSENVFQMLQEVEQASGGHKLSGVAVVSAIMKHQDAKRAAQNLKSRLVDNVVKLTGISALANSDLVQRVVSLLDRVREKKPFVHSITNNVVFEMTANIILHLGGSPIMAHSIDEVEEVGNSIDSLILNMGTLDKFRIASFHKAAQKANSRNVPITLDPIGCGFTSLRRQAVAQLLSSTKISIIKGNAGEIGFLSGSMETSSRGADSVGKLTDPATVAMTVAKKYNTTVCITGAVDYVSDGTRVVRCENGNSYLGLLTGTGCSTTALIASFAGVAEGDYVAASVAGCTVMGVAAEMAAVKCGAGGEAFGPATFRTALFDAVYLLTAKDVQKYAHICLVDVNE